MEQLQKKVGISDIKERRKAIKSKYLLDIQELENDLILNENEMNKLQKDIYEKKNQKKVSQLKLKQLYSDLLFNPDELL